jgi:hypothetical protein
VDLNPADFDCAAEMFLQLSDNNSAGDAGQCF